MAAKQACLFQKKPAKVKGFPRPIQTSSPKTRRCCGHHFSTVDAGRPSQSSVAEREPAGTGNGARRNFAAGAAVFMPPVSRHVTAWRNRRCLDDRFNAFLATTRAV